MSAPSSGLPDLAIWDSIRDCATAALETLACSIKEEIRRDKTLADLRRTGSMRLALEHRALDWMARAYDCCVQCRHSIGQKEEDARFLPAIYYYGLSPFFSNQVLNFLRLAAGVSDETMTRLEYKYKNYNPKDGPALHNASEVWRQLLPTWYARIPKPVVPLNTWSRGSLEAKGVELPTSFPPDFPSSLSLEARYILSRLAKDFPDRSKIEDLCKALVSEYAALLCTGVRSGVLPAHAGPDHLSAVIHYLLVANCDRDNERFEIQKRVINSAEWHAMLKQLLECENTGQKSKPWETATKNVVTMTAGAQDPSQPKPHTESAPKQEINETNAPKSEAKQADTVVERTWSEIEISFLSDERVQIFVAKKPGTTLNYAEFGFEDKRTQIPNGAWKALRRIAELNGKVRAAQDAGYPWKKFEKRVQEIRKVFRSHFDLPTDPIPYIEHHGYVAKFKISCAPSYRS